MSDVAAVSDPWLRLRRALAGTAEEGPRPMSRLELPRVLERLLYAGGLARLRPAAVLVPLIERAPAPTILLTRRADTLRSHSGQISFPGGRRDETDRDFTAAALREAQEEVGIEPSAVEVLGYLEDYPTLTGYRITPVVGRVSGPFEPRIDPAEVAEVFELPLARLLEEGAFARQTLLRDGLRLPFYELHHGGHRIWGATAGILWNLRCRLLNEC
ncbi:MAG: CoA pyrophosphatase [Nevskia sp.]|nr:CoA pyrophosphatase [Nevskia sp.]